MALKKEAEEKIQHIMASLEGDEEEEHEHITLQDKAYDLLSSTPFQCLIAGCILLNAAVIGGETDIPHLHIWHAIETAFLAIFTFECFLRLYSQGVIGFFAPGEDQLWNIFDFGIVGLGLIDFLCEKLGVAEKGSTGISTLFRMIRLLRILRIFKIVRFLKQLYLLAFGFVEAAQAVFWVTVLMVFALYICSIILVRIYGRLLEEDPEHNDPHAQILANQFGTIGVSMLSLFELMSDPGNIKIYHDLMSEFPMLTLFLLAFVIFGSFGMIALLTGVISESMFEKNQMRAAEEREEKEAKREVMEAKCRELFESVETDEDGEALIENLEELLPYIREMFEKFGIEYMSSDLHVILNISDTNDSGYISEEEFVSGIMKLCDGIRASSIQEVHYMLSQLNLKVTKLEKLQDDFIPHLEGDLACIMHHLGIERSDKSPPSSGRSPKHSHTSAAGSNGYESMRLSNQTEVSHKHHHHKKEKKHGTHGFHGDSGHSLAKPHTPKGLGTPILDTLLDRSLSLTPKSHTPRDDQMNLTAKIDGLKAGIMDEQMKLISKQLDDLNKNIHQLCKMPVPLNGSDFTLHKAEMAVKSSEGLSCPPVLPALWSSRSSDLESGDGSQAKLRNCPLHPGSRAEDQSSIRPLSPPPQVSSRRSCLLQEYSKVHT